MKQVITQFWENCQLGPFAVDGQYTHTRPEKRERRVVFFRLSPLGVKMCLFLRKRIILNSIKGHLGVIFQTPPKCPPPKKKACLGVNLRTKSREFSFRGCFSWTGEIAFRVCF